MNLYILLNLAIVVVAIILAFVGRLIYMRSVRLRQKLRMSYVFTNITHELLTPLTVLSASVDKMRDEVPQLSHDYDLMQINIQRMVRMLQQILETSKSQAGELKLLCAQGDVMRYIRETAQYLEPLIAKKKMKYTIECHPESMMGWIDTDKLDKIIYNLVSNAAKYCRENGEVSVIATTNDMTPLPSGDGTRRYLCVEVTAKVDMSGRIPYKQMFAQAVTELRDSNCIYWFTSDDEQEIQRHNRLYQQESAPELVLSEIFEPVNQHKRENLWTATAIQKELDNHLRACDIPNLTNLGLAIKKLRWKRYKVGNVRGYYLQLRAMTR